MATAVYFSIAQVNAFRALDQGDVIVGTTTQSTTAGVIEVSMSETDTSGANWHRAEIESAIDRLKEYIINTYQFKGGAVTLVME
jgi:hypothetical protein